MTAPLPGGLINVTSTPSHVSSSTDPADIRFHRQDCLRRFWQVHDVKSKRTKDTADVRSGHLFWRVWSDPVISATVPEAVLSRLFANCQRDIDLSRFDLPPRYARPLALNLDIDEDDSSESLTTETQESSFAPPSPGLSRRSSKVDVTTTARASQDHTPALADLAAASRRQGTSDGAVALPSRPSFVRTQSGNRKRASLGVGTTKSRTRPPNTRRKSSQDPNAQANEVLKSPRPALKSPRGSTAQEVNNCPQPESSGRSILATVKEKPKATFELPSASSWQSVDSNQDRPSEQANRTGDAEPLAIEKDFRERFIESQRRSQSSSSFAALGKMRKTGSVVRFADEIAKDFPDEVRKGKERAPPSSAEGVDVGGFRHRESVSSVAAGSDDGSEEGLGLLRTKSQLSLQISDLRKQSGSQDLPPAPLSREAGRTESDKKREEEEKLLAMGRQGGVTKAGGVQTRREHRVSGSHDDAGYYSPDRPLY